MGNSPSTVRSSRGITCKKSREEKQRNMGNSPTTVESPPGIRTYRDEKPKDYTLKIQDFSWLKSAVIRAKTYNRYESNIFNAGGYKWKLALYPYGDHKQINGSNHISLYLVTAEDDILSANSELNVLFTFLIYDSIRDRYLTIQDSKIRRFHGMKTEWGFEKLMALPIFNNVSNGFLVNDCCAFGVDIIVMSPNEGKGEVFSLVKQPKNHTFTWKVTDFFNLKNKYYESDLFKVEGYNWKIRLYPRGAYNQGFLSLFLQLQNFGQFPQAFRGYVHHEIAVSSQLGQARKFTSTRWFDGESPGWGWDKFMSLEDLEEPKNGFLYDNNTIMVEAKINAISTSKIV